MANRRLPMRKIKEILRLHFQARLSARQIARSCSVSRATVGDYLSRTRAAQLDWKQVAQMSEAELEGQLFPPPAPRGRLRPPPDLAYVHRELRGKSVTLQLLWQEYKQVHADGYQYSQFCDLYNRWRGKLDVVLRQNHRAGEKMFVDYASQTVEIVDPKTGEMRQASINCLGNSTAGLSANLRAIAWSSSGVWISPLSDPYPGSVINWLAGRKPASTSITTSSSSATASPMLWSASRSRSVTRNTSWRSCTGASGWPRIVATACQEPPLPAPSTVHSVTGVIWSGLLRG